MAYRIDAQGAVIAYQYDAQGQSCSHGLREKAGLCSPGADNGLRCRSRGGLMLRTEDVLLLRPLGRLKRRLMAKVLHGLSIRSLGHLIETCHYATAVSKADIVGIGPGSTSVNVAVTFIRTVFMMGVDLKSQILMAKATSPNTVMMPAGCCRRSVPMKRPSQEHLHG